MLTPGETLSEAYPAVPESVAAARNALTAFARRAGADPDRLEAIRLAASEAVSNAVLHAYQDGEAGTVQLSASYIEDELWVLVADSGAGLRTSSGSSGLGLGLALIAQVADEFQVLSRGSGGTELRLGFKLAPELAASALRSDKARGYCEGSGRGPRGSVSAAFSPA